MKFLHNNYRNFNRTHNWLCNSGGPENYAEAENSENSLIDDDIKRESLGREEKKEKILDLLKSPLRFSYRDIKFIENNIELVEQDKAFRVGFRKIAEYFLSLSVVDSTLMPPRILYQLSGSKLSRRFLPLKLRKSIDLIIDEHTKEIKDLSAEDPSQWSTGKTTKLISLYKYLKKRNEKSGRVLDQDFKIISERLVQKAVNITQKSGKLSSTDRLILWEIKNQVPENFKFSQEVEEAIGSTTKESAQNLINDILNNKDEKNNPDLILLWDTLEDLSYNSHVAISETEKRKLRNFVIRGNATQLVEAFGKSSPKVFLPIHLKAFKDLQENDFKNLWAQTNNDFENEIQISKTDEDTALIKKYEKEIAEIKDEMNTIQTEEFNKLLETQITAEQRQPYDEAKNRLDRFFDEFRSEQDQKNITELIGELKGLFEGKVPFNLKLDPLFSKWTSETSNKKRYQLATEIITAVKDYSSKGINKTIHDENNANVAEKTLNATEQIKELIEAHTQEGNQNNPNGPDTGSGNDPIQAWPTAKEAKVSTILDIFEDQEVLTNWDKHVEQLKATESDIKNTIQQPQTRKEEALNNKLTEVQDKYSKESINNFEKNSIFEIYANPNGEQIKEEYQADLDNRIKNHKLHAADFQVIMGEGLSSDPNKQEIHTFRNKFEQTLANIDIDVSPINLDQIDIENIDSEANFDLIRPWIQHLESQVGINQFRAALEQDLNNFENPQIKDEILKGALGHFHEKIEERIEDAFGGFADNNTQYLAQKNIFLNHVRTHNKVHSPQEIQQIEGAYQQYFNHKTEGVKKVDVERNRLEGALEGINTDDQEKIRAAYQYGVDMLNHGYSTEDFDFPGKYKIQEAALQSAPIKQECLSFNSEYKDLIDSISNSLAKKEHTPDDHKINFDSFFSAWDNQGQSDLESKIESFKPLCENEIFSEKDENGNPVYQKFLNEYFKNIDSDYKNIIEAITELRSVKDNNLTGKEQVFSRIKSGLDKLFGLMNFDSGDFTKYKNYLENRLFEHKVKDKYGKDTDIDENGFAETIQDLKDREVFDNPEEATRKFRNERANFNVNLRNFEHNIKKVNHKISHDIKALSDENFEAKYGMYKNEARHIVNGNSEQINDFNDHWKTYNKKDYFDDWLKKYNESTESRFSAIKEFQDFERLGQTLSEMDQNTDGIKRWLTSWDEYGEIERKNRWYNRMGTEPISLYSIYHMIKQTMEIVETRWKRKQDKMAYNTGQQVFGDSAWGKEFRRMGEESEEERVKQWETTYEELDVWDVAEHLYKTKDLDEAKACIKMLNEKGYLKWDNPRLWRTLMRLQSTVTFNIPEDMSLEVTDISKKVGLACEIIWSKEVFRQWDTSIDENINKSKGSHEKEFRDLTDSRLDGISALSNSLASMLEKWKKGDTADVYPDKFISFLHMAFEQGKLNTQPDKRWYYLIKGVTTKNPQGEALISKTTFMKFNSELLASMPYFDFFIDKNSWKKDGKIVPPNTPGAHQGVWTYEDFLGWSNIMGDANGKFLPDTNSAVNKDIERFFYRVVDMSEEARGRVKRMGRAAKDEADHDDGETFFTGLEEKEVLQMLSSMSQGTQQVTDDFWRAFLAGFDRYMKNRQEMIQEWDNEYGLDDPNWQNMRKKILKDVGIKLKTAVTVTQTLSGSIKTDQTSPLIWGEKDWEKSDGLAIKKGQSSKDEINGMLSNMLDSTGDPENYKAAINAEFYKKSQNFKQIEASDGWTDHNKKISALLSDEGGSMYFADTDKIWKALRNYGDGGLSGLSIAA